MNRRRLEPVARLKSEHGALAWLIEECGDGQVRRTLIALESGESSTTSGSTRTAACAPTRRPSREGAQARLSTATDVRLMGLTQLWGW